MARLHARHIMERMQTATYDRLQYLVERVMALTGETFRLGREDHAWLLHRVNGTRVTSVFGSSVTPTDLVRQMAIYIKSIEAGRKAAGLSSRP